MTKNLKNIAKKIFVLITIPVLSACAIGPDYVRPEVDLGTQFKALDQQQSNAKWIQFNMDDISVRSDWWLDFQDNNLNQLMLVMLDSNYDLQKAYAQYSQAQASLDLAKSGFFPNLSATGSATRSGSGGPAPVQNQYNTSANISWEPDLWGRVRRTVEASQASLQASQADLAVIKLSLQSTLAQTYFNYIQNQQEAQLLRKTIEVYQRSLDTNQNRLNVGMATRSDVAAATVQLENAKLQLQNLIWQGQQLHNAMAQIQGLVPSAFKGINTQANAIVAPTVPINLPSSLLQKRPDIVAAEKRVQQANANIGIAQSAWLPDLTLSAQGGYRSSQWAQLLTSPSQFWTLGPALALSIFDGGAKSARIEEAKAAYLVQTAGYKQTIVSAMQEIEDILARLNSIDAEILMQRSSLDAARETLTITRNQYDVGMIDYLSVVQTETSALNSERSMLALKNEKLIYIVRLIAALGGGWVID